MTTTRRYLLSHDATVAPHAPSLKVVRDFASVRDASGRAPMGQGPRRQVVEMAEDDLTDFRLQHLNVALEEDLPLSLLGMPGLPPMVDAQAAVREVCIRVCDQTGQPVADCSVYALSGGVGYSAITDADGQACLVIQAQPLDRVIVSPRHSHWSRVLSQPEQTQLIDELTVTLQPLMPGRDSAWIHALLGTGEFWHHTGLAGAGVKVAVVDSGVDPCQGIVPVIGGLNTLDGEDPQQWWIDPKGHGTHCAGVIGGTTSTPSGWFSGVAPLASIYSVKVFPGGYVSDLVEAIDWCIEQGMDVVNLSLGSPQPSPALTDALLRAYAAGVTVIAAAGNEATHIAYPASTKPVLSVGAIGRLGTFPNDSGHQLKVGRYQAPSGHLFSAGFSNFGQELEVVAPGVAIISTVPGGFAAWDGTSMASPQVAGVAALLLSACPWMRTGDRQQVDHLLYYLRQSAVNVGLPVSVQGLGVPHAWRACQMAHGY